MNETVANQGISLLPGRNQRLSARLLLYVVLISSAFTLVVTAFQLYLDFQRDIRTVHESVDFIQESYLPALAQSAYDLDDRQMRSLLEGALKLPDIVYLEVVEVDAGGERLLAARGDTDAPRDIYETFALPYPSAPAGTPPAATASSIAAVISTISCVIAAWRALLNLRVRLSTSFEALSVALFIATIRALCSDAFALSINW